NTVNGVAALNSATGNGCGNAASPTPGARVTPPAGRSSTDSQAVGGAQDSPGVLAGNSVQVPVEAPVNVCGNTVNGVAALNSATGNGCGNAASPTPGARVTPSPSGASSTSSSTLTPPPTRVTETPRTTPSPTRSQTLPPAGEEQPGGPPQLAETGSKTLLATSAASAALLTGGVMLYRRGRAASQR
ncbi:chaplin, partial [Streptomyces sp. NPDC048304]|uniref:chaplin n=1 Tax=Streptomyces sp. NPDC048304 TaxID=3154820 RepID=UPI0033D034CB